MKKVVFITLMTMLSSMVCMAGDEVCTTGVCGQGSPGSVRLNLEVYALTSFRNKGMTMHGYNFDAAISIYRDLYALGSFEILSYHAKDSKTYFNSTGLSGGLVYNILDKENTTIPFKMKIGGTLGSPDWKYTFYDTSVSINQRLGKSNFAGVVGVGYRYEHSRIETMSSHGFVYIFFGIKI